MGNKQILSFKIGEVTKKKINNKEFPAQFGNYFCLVAENSDAQYFVLNCNYENFIYLLENTDLHFPVEIEILSKTECKIIDGRIDKKFLIEN